MKHLFFICLLSLILTPNLWSQDLSINDSLKWKQEGLVFTDLANQAWYKQAYDSCLIYGQLAYEAYTKAQQWEKANIELLGITGVYYRINDLEKTQTSCIRAEEHARRHLSPKHMNFGKILNFQGLVLGLKGQYRSASLKLEKAGKIFELNKASAKRLAGHLQNRANFQRKNGDYDDAINNLMQALRYRQTIANDRPSNTALIYIHLAYNYVLKKEFDTAIQFNRKAIELLKTIDPLPTIIENKIEVYLNLSKIYRKKNQKDSARYAIQKALHLQKEEVIYLKDRSYSELGELDLMEQKFKLALGHFQKALDFAQARYKKYQQHPNLSAAWQKVAFTQLAMGEHTTAIESYQTALQKLAPEFESSNFKDNPSVDQLLSLREGFSVLQGKGKALFQHYQMHGDLVYLEEALASYQVLVKLIKKARNSFLAEESKLHLQSNALTVFEEGIEIALRLHEITKNNPYLSAAFNFAEQNKSILMQEALASNQALGFGGIPDSLLEKENNLRNDIAFYKRQILELKRKATFEEEQLKQKENELFALQKKHQTLQATLSTDFPDYFTLKNSADHLRVDKLQNEQLEDQELLLEYFVGQQMIYLFAISKSAVHVFRLPERETIVKGVERIRQLLMRPALSRQLKVELEEFNQLSYGLYQQLLAPALEPTEHVTRLTIIPDAHLNYLPFGVLQTQTNTNIDFRPDRKNYLLASYIIGYQYSAKAFNQPVSNSNAVDAPFVGFAPSFKNQTFANRSCSQDEMYSLACNQPEVAAIQDLVGGQSFLAQAASKDHFIQQIKNAGIIHLATHACVDLETDALNQIFFTDDYLTSVELKNLQLQARMAVLSACNTGSGKLQTGEGLMSLARSFTIAGCPSTLMSLWSVDDCATSDIMLLFYQELKAGKDQPTAIRNAKLQYLATASKEKAHPYYWAPFQMVGASWPVLSPPSNTPYYGLGFVVLLLVFVRWRFIFGAGHKKAI